MKQKITSLALVIALILTASGHALAGLSEDISHGSPSGIIALKDGGYLLTDVFNKVIWNVDNRGAVKRAAGQISTPDVSGEPVGLLADGTVLTAFFQNPWDITPFLDGYLVSEPDANVIRYFDTAAVQTAAGSGKAGFHDANGIKATFSRPTGLASGDNGEVYIADTDNGAIRCMDINGNVTTFYSGLSEPTGLCWHQGTLYVAETGSHCVSAIHNGTRTVLAGTPDQEGYTDGLASATRLRSPMGITVGPDGTVYISDTGNGAVRRLRGGIVSTLSRSTDANAPIRPRGLLVTGDTLLVADPFGKNVCTLSLAEEVYSDVAHGSWYRDAVYAAVERGLFNGVGNGLFAPNATTNRAMLAQMLANLQQQLDNDIVINGNAALSDVSDDDWYAGAARWAVSSGFMDSRDGAFDPLREITRQEMIATLWLYARSLGENVYLYGDLETFRDAGEVDINARDGMSWALATGLIRGVSTDELSPNTTTTRAQMVQVMIRFMDLLQQ